MNPSRIDSTAFADAPRALAPSGISTAIAECLLRSAGAGVGVVDRQMRYLQVSDTLAAMNGRPAAAHVGLSIYDVVPKAAPTLESFARRVIDSGEPIVDVPLLIEHPAGVQRQLLASYYPVLDDEGAIVAVASIVLEHTAGEESTRRAINVAAREADRARVLRRVMARLNEATTIPQVASIVVEDAIHALGADGGFLAFVVCDAEGRPTEFEPARIAGYEERVTTRHMRAPIVQGRPVSQVALTGNPIFVESPEAWTVDWPSAPEDLESLGFHSFAAVPVKVGERVVAALSFSFREPHCFDAATRDFLGTLAEQCAPALERARLYEAGRDAAQRQAALLATMRDAFVALDRDLRLTYVNARAEELLREPADELLGRRLADVLPQIIGTPVEQAMHRVRATGAMEQVELSERVAGAWVEARLYPAPDGVSLVLQDISARRRRQDATAFLAEASRQLATSLDYQQTIRVVAESAVPALGDWCAVALIERPELDEWPPRLERVAVAAHDPQMLPLAQRMAERYPIDWSSTIGLPAVLRTGQPAFVPVITDEMLGMLAKDAEHLALMRALKFSAVIIVPLVARDVTLGALTLCMTASGRRFDADDLALAQDLAQRQALAVDNARLFLQARRARAEAEAANRAKTDFLAVMSYELRTPLNAIGGYARILDLELHGPLTDQQRTTLERIRRSQVHLAAILNQVLSFAHLESGTVTYDLRPLRLGEVVADALPRVEALRAAKRLGLQLRMPTPSDERGACVLADGEKLQQVLHNLLSNAMKFTTTGGNVSVELLPEPDERGMAVLRVADTGIGIPESQLQTVFDPFVQVDRSLNNPGEGTGLGLAISRVLARGMGGDLTVASTYGEGSTFTLRLRRV